MKKLICVFALAIAPIFAGTVTLNFAVHLDTRFEYGLRPYYHQSYTPGEYGAFNVAVLLNDSVATRETSTQVFPDGAILRLTDLWYPNVQIDSPLSGLLDLGYDLSDASPLPSYGLLESAYLYPDNNWTSLVFRTEYYSVSSTEKLTAWDPWLAGVHAEYFRSLGLGRPMSIDPSILGPEHLRPYVLSLIGQSFSFAEGWALVTSSEPRTNVGDFGYLGSAILESVTFESSAVPEPSSAALVLSAAAVLLAVRKRLGGRAC